MRNALTLVFLVVSLSFSGSVAFSDQTEESLEDIVQPGESADLESLVWVKRPLVIFADSPNDPRFIQQMNFVDQGLDELADRDVVVLTDTAGRKGSALRDKLHPRGFAIVLFAKDGTIYLRKPVPWDVREISRVIDKLPMRQQEVRDRRALKNGS